MKVLFAAPYFAPEVGGVENYVLHVAKGLQERKDVAVVVLTTTTERNVSEYEVQRIRVVAVPRLAKVSNTPVHTNWGKVLRSIIARENPSVVNAHTPVPYFADIAIDASGNVPTVLTYHNDIEKKSALGKAASKLYYGCLGNRTLTRADAIITTSRAYAESSTRLAPHLAKTRVAAPGVDLERFHPQIDREWLRERFPGRSIILFVGQLDHTHTHKGLGLLIHSVGQLRWKMPDIALVVVGFGDHVPYYQREAKAAGIEESTHFVGHVGDDQLASYYAGAHVLALPSLNRSEGFGMVLIEAGACGTPVVASAIGGIPSAVVQGRTGLLVEPGSSRSLVDALHQVLNDPGLAERLGRQAQERAVAEFTWEMCVDRTLDVLAEVVDAARG